MGMHEELEGCLIVPETAFGCEVLIREARCRRLAATLFQKVAMSSVRPGLRLCGWVVKEQLQ